MGKVYSLIRGYWALWVDSPAFQVCSTRFSSLGILPEAASLGHSGQECLNSLRRPGLKSLEFGGGGVRNPKP